MQSTCVICSNEFTPKKGSKAKTCSPVCREKYRVQRTIEVSVREGAWVTKTCAVCDKEFTRRKGKEGTVCSVECRAAKQKKEGQESRVCTQCGKVFDNYHRQSQNTCSVQCAAKARAGGRNYPPCETCGKPTGSYYRAFCDDHLGTRKGRKPAPRKVAQCLGCGEEFSRPGHWRGKMHYCSNKCSHSQQKKVRDKYVAILNDHAVVFHSGWEIRFYAACLRFDIPIRSYDGPDIKTSEGVYRPDFIIGKPGEERVVDVKGWLRPESEIKCREAGVHLVTKQELLRLESGDSLDAHRMLVWNSGMDTHTAVL